MPDWRAACIAAAEVSRKTTGKNEAADDIIAYVRDPQRKPEDAADNVLAAMAGISLGTTLIGTPFEMYAPVIDAMTHAWTVCRKAQDEAKTAARMAVS